MDKKPRTRQPRKRKGKDKKLQIDKIYNLSPMQEGMLFHSILEKESNSYYQQISFVVEGEFEPKVLEKSLNIIIDRHDILRTNFVHEKVKRPQQVVFKDRSIKMYFEDLSQMEETQKETILNEFIEKEKEQGFDLLKGKLIKLSVLKLDKELYKVILSNHHIILDGWSIGVITKELIETYKMLINDEPVELHKAKPFIEYINWLKKIDKEEAANYWSEYLAGYDQKTDTPRLYKKVEDEEYLYNDFEFKLDENFTKELENLARTCKVTLNTVVQTIWGLLLQRYNNVEDSAFGSIVSGRPPEVSDVENMVGLFINVLPVRVKTESGQTFKELVEVVQKQQFESRKHEYTSLAEIQSLTELKQGLFDNIIEFENYPIEKALLDSKDDQKFTIKEPYLYMLSNYDLNISVIPGDELEIKFRFNENAYSNDLVRRISEQLECVIKQIIYNPEVALKDIQIITEDEKSKVLIDFNDNDTNYPEDKTLNELFEKQVEKTPENIAVVHENKSLTYRELNNKANQLARLLRKKGVKKGDLVAMLFNRSTDMIVGIMGILKAGAAYLPIDPEYPDTRITGILEDSKVPYILAQRDAADMELLKDIPDAEIMILEDISETLSKESTENLEIINNSDDIVYVIYTSGSTGKPKGNLITHYNVSRVVLETNYIDINDQDTLLQLSNYAFDGSTFDIYGAILNGAKLVMINKDVLLDVSGLSELIKKESITLFFVTTALFNALVDVNIECFDTVRKVLFGGERVSVRHVAKALEYMGKGRILHVYGPTESTVYASFYNVDSIDERLGTIPIGKPLSNTQIYILDKNNNIQPIGIPGELCISGKGLAKGYLNRPELTSEKFIPHPLIEGETLYRTGDLARWLPSGDVEFLDRIDTQVKLRGFRIELGEIESNLLDHPNIKEAVVICKDHGESNKFLHGYIVLKDKEKELSVPELREYLSRELPDYMIPSYFALLDSMPLTSNGKVDKKELETYEKMDSGVEYVPPRNEIEKILVEAWQEILGVENIGINDNYFSQGGDSIKAIQIASRLQKDQLKMEIKDLFKHPTIGDLSSHIKVSNKKIKQDVVEGEMPFTPIQEWFFGKQFTNMNHFNHSVMLHSKDGFDKEIVKQVFTKIAKHHDALRMVYKTKDNGIAQYNRKIEGELIEFNIVDLSDEADYKSKIEEEANKVHASINLEQGSLLKLKIFKTQDGEHLLIVIHHLVVDGVSWRIILEDFATGYMQASKGESISFQDKTTSFKEWAKKINEYATKDKGKKELGYWKNIAGTEILPLPKDSESEENRVKDSENIAIELTEEETQKLLKDVNKAYNTEINDILLSALGRGLNEWCGHDKFLINMEGHGREDIIEEVDINRTVGWFTSAYPVVLNMEKREDISYSIKIVKDELNRIPNKGIGYGILRYLASDDIKEAIKLNIEPEISFNYLGQFDVDMETEVFSASKYPTGDLVSPDMERNYILDINGFIKDNKLTLTLNYNKNEYEKETIEKLAQSYKESILANIEHCIEKEKTEYTPTDFLYKMLSIEDLDEVGEQFKDSEIENIYPLTPMQEGMLYNSLVDKESYAYFEQISFDIHNDMNIDMLEKSLNNIIQRHEILRVVFNHEKGDRPIQIILKERLAKVEFEDITEMNESKKDEYIENFKTGEKDKGFDLSKDLLIKLAVFKTDSETYRLIFSFHHILMDGWCIGIIIKEFFQTYKSLEEEKILTQDSIYSYGRYIEWLDKQDEEESRTYWQEYLKGYEQQSSLPKNNVVGENVEYNQTEFVFKLDEDITKGIANIAEKNNVTLSTVFQTIWGTILKRYSVTEDVVFGTVVSGRPHEIKGVDKIVGLFINTIPVRVNFQDNKTFDQLIKGLQNNSLESEKHSYFPLAKIQSDTDLKQGLLDHIIVFENYPLEDEIEGSGESGGLYGYSIDNAEVFEQTNYDFNIIVMPGRELIIKLNYNGLAYNNEFIERIEGHFNQVAKAVIENSKSNINDIHMLTGKEEEKILVEFNDTKADYPSNKTLHKLFEEQVENNPNNIAAIYEDSTLTYRELNEKSNQLARKLREKGVKSDSIVGIMLERSLEMTIGIMAIIKAGGAYLPIDPKYPKDRIEYMLEDSGAKLLLVKEGNNESKTKENKINTSKVKAIMDEINFSGETIDIEDESMYQGEIDNLEYISNPNDLAYIIYTSGSTGKPKGVMIEHHSAINRIDWMQSRYGIDENDVILQKTPFTFDVSVWELFWWSIVGSKVCFLKPEGEKDPQTIVDAINKHKVTTMHFVPSMLNIFLEHVEGNEVTEQIKTLKQVFSSGEALSLQSVNKFNELLNSTNGTRLINLYGPTEATVDVSYFDCWGQEFNVIPIGKPINNINLYVIGKDNKLQPIGVPGELCISGVGVARGYLNRPELTAEKFVDNPFNPKEKMYKTGDLARWMEDGNIEYLGRIDYQVKVRGFRIELGEIENKLLDHEDINESVVLARDDDNGNKYLCGYIVADRDIEIKELRDHLSKELPEYMIPSFFVQLDCMPLTHNGKANRKALPEPNKGITTNQDYIAPRNEIEEAICVVWKEVLGIENVGMKDSFLELGGDSIKAIQVSARLKKHRLKLEIKDIFQYKNIEEIAKVVTKIEELTINQGSVRGDVELTPIQNWFFENEYTNMHHWNQAVMLHGKDGFNPSIVEKVFKKIVEHHDALRMTYKNQGEDILQYNRDMREGEYPTLEVYDLKDDKDYKNTIEEKANELQSGINLDEGSLVKLALFKTIEGDHLLVIIHHLVVDGVSWRIIFEDFATGYNQEQNNKEIKFQDKSHSFKDWASKLKEYGQGKEIQEELEHWSKIENTDIPVLPIDNEDIKDCRIKDNETVEMSLSDEYTEKLLKEVNKAYNTEINDILLASLGLAIKEWIDQDKVLVSVEGHGREDIIKGLDITRTVGWFTSLYPVLLNVDKYDDISYLIRTVKEDIRKIPNKGVGYGILRYLTSNENKNVTFRHSPEISFNYLGQLGQDVNTDLFKLSNISVGEMVSPESESKYKLNINGVITDDKLVIGFNYNTNEYTKDTILKLVEYYKKNLTDIIDHCISQFDTNNESHLTPSDVGDNDLSIDDLEYMSDFLDTL